MGDGERRLYRRVRSAGTTASVVQRRSVTRRKVVRTKSTACVVLRSPVERRRTIEAMKKAIDSLHAHGGLVDVFGKRGGEAG